MKASVNFFCHEIGGPHAAPLDKEATRGSMGAFVAESKGPGALPGEAGIGSLSGKTPENVKSNTVKS